jgi:hypothetical protein
MSMIPPKERHALQEARDVWQEHGIEICLPWEGDMDDLDRERFQAMREACQAYHSKMITPSP